MVKTRRTWETIHFKAISNKAFFENKGNKGIKLSETLELTINRENKRFSICEDNEEGVRFDNVSIDRALLKSEAIVSALKYVKANL